jgi:hypothetical protein
MLLSTPMIIEPPSGKNCRDGAATIAPIGVAFPGILLPVVTVLALLMVLMMLISLSKKYSLPALRI